MSVFTLDIYTQHIWTSRIGVDEKLRVPGFVDVYAIGDCAGFVESVGKPVLPALAQVALPFWMGA